ncbi:hypothetical protein IMZ68_03015 [Candidatus Bathyarchaeota archaeon]|nr:hypothetical protein [Candidatus Bathyarchaeota archaeon]
MASEEIEGNTLNVYAYVAKEGRPVGTRDVTRGANLSSPSVAQYHLSKLEHAGLVKREMGNYTINKVLLESCMKISRFLVPRYLFYSIFAVVILLIELTFLKPDVLSREYFFSTVATAIFVLIFCYETAKVWLKGSL